jgi:hypothetical protein
MRLEDRLAQVESRQRRLVAGLATAALAAPIGLFASQVVSAH